MPGPHSAVSRPPPARWWCRCGKPPPMRDPHVTSKEAAIAEACKRKEAAITEACKLLRPLTKPARSRSAISWNDPDASNDPRDKFEAAVEFVIALLDPATPTTSAQAETYDRAQQYLADEVLGPHASIVRTVVLPTLRLGRPPKRKGP